eukprot:Protomagalhaensia_wolfi_Nauph_80__5760@NODE_702_length_2091_cov_25_018031_g525_i0_p1_GENE_NODE_702_length_2091_cov_25_018031_g525_i0NODE_702_length_2091_cov_25_018031_g525_i0_p1_ORF_typecomplete_len274_score33_19zfC3HC4_2/PF13923_6/5_8e14zfC3HC4_3/PF13920_6/5_4e13ProkRING_4/PF14447_6/1e11zfC3HC4/PF00097_25/1_6e10zfRING_5/PF14634_6/1_1e09zfC3HC4_4/PF15227_6/2e08zfRING_UBOX/PF13445_6/5_2e08zfRING_UBOX/PF13445_6/1_9e02Ubox/PF04564_15/1_5e07zfRING_2/PF13639_6/6_7e07zfRING_6/PF14835_6/1_2e06zfNOSIP/P
MQTADDNWKEASPIRDTHADAFPEEEEEETPITDLKPPFSSMPPPPNHLDPGSPPLTPGDITEQPNTSNVQEDQESPRNPHHHNQSSSTPTGNPDSSSDGAKVKPFDCNVCFDLAQDPVVTRCGHLYCWPCLHAWLKQVSECPVCKAQVTRDTVVPIYGQGQNTVDPRSKPEDIPQRPRPERVEAPRRTRAQQNMLNWNLGLLTGTSFTFGIFPFGVGITWPGAWFTQGGGQNGTHVASTEEVFSQLLSMAFLFIAIFVTLGIVFSGDNGPEF